MKTKRITARVTDEEYAMIEAYARMVDRDMAALLRHSIMSLLRRDKRRVDERWHELIG